MLDELLDEIEDGGTRELRGAAIGIDLGTTNSIAYIIADGSLIAIVDEEGRELQPSVVAWTPDGGRLVGESAKVRRVLDPLNTVYSAKRLIGQSFRSDTVQRAIAGVPYSTEEGERQEILIGTRLGPMSIPQISAFVLGRLKAMAENCLGRPVTHCVITVPANFSDAQRSATRQAAQLAGMEVLRILNEPTAAAIAYGEGRTVQQRIAVFDLGGGTFDVSVLGVRSKLYEVIATGGDSFLGGDDVDRILFEWLADIFLRSHRIDARVDPVATARLMLAAEEIKKGLSSEEYLDGRLNEVSIGANGEILGLDFAISRDEFNALIMSFAQTTIAVVDRVLAEAKLEPQDINEVILVGGSTAIPLIQTLVEEKFGKTPRFHIDPMKVVALGAAIQAERLVNPSKDRSVLLDVTPHSLRISTVSGFSRVLVEKNTAIPAEGVASFFTAKDNQSTVTIRVCQGENEKWSENAPLGELVLDGLPVGRRGEIGVLVAFTIDADGILQVSAKDAASDSAAHATLTMIGLQEKR